MSLRDSLARFCPYTTLKKEASSSENPLVKRFRERKTFISMVVVAALLIPMAYSFFSNPQTKLVTLRDLEIRVITDKKEYRVNETIKVELCVFNNNSYSVMVKPIKEIYVSGNSVYILGNSVIEPQKISGILILDYPAEYQYILIDANSRHVIYKEEFVARLPGEFLINMLGASVSVNVM